LLACKQGGQPEYTGKGLSPHILLLLVAWSNMTSQMVSKEMTFLSWSFYQTRVTYLSPGTDIRPKRISRLGRKGNP